MRRAMTDAGERWRAAWILPAAVLAAALLAPGCATDPAPARAAKADLDDVHMPWAEEGPTGPKSVVLQCRGCADFDKTRGERNAAKRGRRSCRYRCYADFPCDHCGASANLGAKRSCLRACQAQRRSCYASCRI